MTRRDRARSSRLAPDQVFADDSAIVNVQAWNPVPAADSGKDGRWESAVWITVFLLGGCPEIWSHQR
jgi:hypothetical protein